MTRGRRANIISLVFVSACAGTTEPGRAGVPVLGSWDYIAVQTSPATADLRGVITFATQSGSAVGGSHEVLETDVRGQQRRLAGPISGRTVDSTTLDIELGLDVVARRHVGIVRGDSLTGTWLEIPRSGSSLGASGTFRAKRRP